MQQTVHPLTLFLGLAYLGAASTLFAARVIFGRPTGWLRFVVASLIAAAVLTGVLLTLDGFDIL